MTTLQYNYKLIDSIKITLANKELISYDQTSGVSVSVQHYTNTLKINVNGKEERMINNDYIYDLQVKYA